MTETKKPCLEITNLDFSYGEIPALSDISFGVNKGEVLGIIGPNGAGKTTLLKCLLKSAIPKCGSISLLGKPLSEYSSEQLARLVSYVPQETTVPFAFTVLDIVQMGRYPHYSPFESGIKKDPSLIQPILKHTGLSDLKDRSFNELSGGEKKRVLLARAFAQDSPFLLLDEPGSNLDIKHISSLLKILLTKQKQKNQTILFVTHDLNLAMTLANRLILLKRGAIIKKGTPGDTLTLETIRELYDVSVRIIEDKDSGAKFFSYRLDT